MGKGGIKDKKKRIKIEISAFTNPFYSYFILKAEGREFTSNVQGNPKSIKPVLFYTGFCPNFSEYYDLIS